MNDVLDRVGSPRFLGTAVIAAWTMYFTMISLTNVLDAIRAMTDSTFSFASGNWEFMQQTVAVYGTPDWVTGVLFAGAIALEIGVAVLCWRALALRVGDSPLAASATRAALACALLVWASFIFMEEVFLAYAVESTHWMLLVAAGVSYGVCFLVDRPRELATASENGGAQEAERRVLDIRRHVLVEHADRVPTEREASLN